jgi:hypothetical protein
MKYLKITIFAVLLFSYTSITAQNIFPTYYKVVKSFFTKYNYDTDEDYNILFAKMKGGWYVNLVDNYLDNNILSSQLYWSNKTNQFNNLTFNLPSRKDKSLIPQNIEKYIVSYEWYNFDHCAYYGYNGYANDIIADFSNKENIDDRALESLARAYSVKSSNYLWNHFDNWRGKDDDMDTTELKPFEFPSSDKVKKAIFYLNKAFETYAVLAKRNPSYETLVGDVKMKASNEAMYAYELLMTVGYNEEASQFLKLANYDEKHIEQAKNRLNACLKNTILITFGDDDTYPLWYVQEKLGYRKDVSVLNFTLLSMQSKVLKMKQKGEVAISTPNNFLMDSNIYVVQPLNVEEDSLSSGHFSLSETLNYIYTYKLDSITEHDASYKKYPSKYFYLKVNNDLEYKFNKSYLFLNDIILLDIVNSNINKRPIAFTSTPESLFNDYVIFNNLNYKLNTVKMSESNYNEVINFKNKLYKPIYTSIMDGSNYISYDGDASVNGIYYFLIQYNIENENIDEANKFINELISFNAPKDFIGFNNLIIYSLYRTQQTKKAIPFLENSAILIRDKYFKPSAIKGYVSKKTALAQVNQLIEMLKESKLKNEKISMIKQEIMNSH